MYIVGGTGSKSIAEDLSEILKQPLAKTAVKRFPDRELYVRILDEIKNEDIIIVQTTYPNTNIIELFLLLDAAVEAGAGNITVVTPYFGYGRQDKKFETGEPISARAIAQLISMHANKLITVDPHKEHLLKFFNIPAYSCSAISEIARYLKQNKNLDLVLAPDEGAKDRAIKVAKIIGCEQDYMQKKRINGTTVEIKPKNLDVENKKVAIIDDIISTGGTMAISIKELKKQGAKEVYVACTHGLFVQKAKPLLLSAGVNEIISTDTVRSEYSKVKVAPCIVKILTKTK
jgi:ribose-phosphate pyrophosphokinase